MNVCVCIIIIVYILIIMEGENNYDEQYDEIQALESIFTEDFHLVEERPFKFEINVNSN